MLFKDRFKEMKEKSFVKKLEIIKVVEDTQMSLIWNPPLKRISLKADNVRFQTAAYSVLRLTRKSVVREISSIKMAHVSYIFRQGTSEGVVRHIKRQNAWHATDFLRNDPREIVPCNINKDQLITIC